MRPLRASTSLSMLSSISRPYLIVGGGGIFLVEASTTLAISSSRPTPFTATVGTTGTPSSCESLSESTLIPLLWAMSTWLRATTILGSSSRSWRVKKRFLSRTEASTTLMRASGCSTAMYSLLTISSIE